jgi:hypothetical protein
VTREQENDGRLEHAQQMAGHESPRTTKLYDRTKDEITLSEVERIRPAVTLDPKRRGRGPDAIWCDRNRAGSFLAVNDCPSLQSEAEEDALAQSLALMSDSELAVGARNVVGLA